MIISQFYYSSVRLHFQCRVFSRSAFLIAGKKVVKHSNSLFAICNSTLLHTHPEFTRIVFHGLRHSSATYQLMISGGDVKTVQRPCSLRIKRKSHEESCDSSWDFGALEETRIPGPLIKRIKGASFVKFQKFEETLFLSYHRKTCLCMHRVACIQCNALQPLSSYSGVRKVCKNVQTGKTKPNGQINHRFYGRV